MNEMNGYGGKKLKERKNGEANLTVLCCFNGPGKSGCGKPIG